MYSVLIADDEINIVEGLRDTMSWREHGCVVLGVAYDGRQAMELAERQIPDIVVTDITMPGMTGLELMENLLHRSPQTCFIVLTCHEDFAFAREALRLGACDYLVKETMTRQELYASLEKAKQSFCQKRELLARATVQEDPELKRMTGYIQAHLSERVTLDDMARMMAMNPSYLSRFFKNKLGETFVDYLSRMRIQYAMEQLRCTSLPIQLIAEQAGYNNLSYFHAAFKRASGMAPAAYRREQKKGEK